MLVVFLLTLLLGLSQAERTVKDEKEVSRVVGDKEHLGDKERLVVDIVMNYLSHGMRNNKANRQMKSTLPPPTFSPPPCATKNTTCENSGGFCYAFLEPIGCDYRETGMCSQSYCKCCIDCSRNTEKSDCVLNGGTCRKECECLSYEYSDLYSCPAAGCTCCRPCKTSPECGKEGGECVGNVTAYTEKGYTVVPSVKCTEEDCTCVRPPCGGKECPAINGRCVTVDQLCPRGYLSLACGCGPPEYCKCCVLPVAITRRDIQEA